MRCAAYARAARASVVGRAEEAPVVVAPLQHEVLRDAHAADEARALAVAREVRDAARPEGAHAEAIAAAVHLERPRARRAARRRAPPRARAGRCRRCRPRPTSSPAATSSERSRSALGLAQARRAEPAQRERRRARRAAAASRAAPRGRSPDRGRASCARALRASVVRGSTVPSVRPWRSTVTRSATSRISSSLWEMKITAQPAATRRRSTGKSARVSPGVSAAVGSSSTSTRAPRPRARRISARWRWPTESSSARHAEGHVEAEALAQRLGAARARRGDRTSAPPPARRRRGSPRRETPAPASSAGGPCPPRRRAPRAGPSARRSTGAAAEARALPRSGRTRPSEHVHQRRLAGAVLAEERVHLARGHGELGALAGPAGPTKRLGDALEADRGRGIRQKSPRGTLSAPERMRPSTSRSSARSASGTRASRAGFQTKATTPSFMPRRSGTRLEAPVLHAARHLDEGAGEIQRRRRDHDVRRHRALVAVGAEGVDGLAGRGALRDRLEHAAPRVVRLVDQEVGALLEQRQRRLARGRAVVEVPDPALAHASRPAAPGARPRGTRGRCSRWTGA